MLMLNYLTKKITVKVYSGMCRYGYQFMMEKVYGIRPVIEVF